MRAVITRGIFSFLVLVLFASMGHAQSPAKRRAAAKKAEAARTQDKSKSVPPERLMHVIGIRPGLSIDSVIHVAEAAGVKMREVQQDTITHCFADQSVKIYVIDSIYCRLTYMRMSFLFDGTTKRLRRFTMTPRMSSIANGQDDDLMEVLLLYFGQTWGKPELNLEPPANFRWRGGNLEVRGYIKRGYPIWVMEG